MEQCHGNERAPAALERDAARQSTALGVIPAPRGQRRDECGEISFVEGAEPHGGSRNVAPYIALKPQELTGRIAYPLRDGQQQNEA